jgi:HlyD family secretion protein
MDISRPELGRRKRVQHLAMVGGGIGLVITVTVGLANLEPAAPEVPRSSVWVEVVREGEMLREVRGNGTLVPRELRWIAAQTEGRVERIVVRPGAQVKADTVLVEMSNPDLQQQTEEARHALQAARGDLTEAELRVRNRQLDQRVALAVARAELEGARLQAEAEKPLVEKGIVPTLQYRRSELLAGQLKVRLEIEQERLDRYSASMEDQLASSRAHVEQARNAYERRLAQIESLHIRAGLGGVLQQVMVEAGQRVAMGTNIARVARPDGLRAELRVPETQARDVQLGQPAKVDTHNGIVEGSVLRIDPAVQDGTVQVDIELTGQLPRGARPDLSVEGTIEIERLPHVVFTGRPAASQPESTVELFKLVEGGQGAVRVPVVLGRMSVSTAEILRGLAPGDQVIVSDTSAWQRHDRIHLN